MKKVRVGIIGIYGLAGGMLLKLLSNHEFVDISLLVSDGFPDKNIEDLHKSLKNLFSYKTSRYDAAEVIEKCDIVFLAKPHGQFLKKTCDLINQAKEKGKKIKFIDLSADFRLKDVDLYPKWYNIKHSDETILQKAVYGLSEINTEKIKNAFFVANPGCYPTCVILGAAPLFTNKFVDSGAGVIIDAHCGVSGAGRTLAEKNMAIEVEENIKPYKVAVHAHTPEIEQELSFLMQENINVLFVPHVSSFKCGMLITTYLKLRKNVPIESIRDVYNKFYQGKPFIRVYEGEEYPEIQNIQGTNFCDIKVVFDQKTRTCIVISSIDNLIKGASGQAIQNMNLMCGFDEACGLPYSNILKKE
jgi:N-acetyl-gamma-glutamyl-phosphate reductase